MVRVTARPVYLATAPDAVFGYFHPAEGGRTGVLICPPFGWDEVASYRVRYRWAEQLAAAGHSALRIDFPGAGDSAGSPRGPARLDAWVAAVSDAAGWLRAEAGVERIALIGLGLGGIAGHLAGGRGAPIDDLVLWGLPARGKAYLRELRAFARFNEIVTLGDEPGEPVLPDGYLEVSGHVISAETVAALQAVDLAQVPLPDARVLLLDRDGVEPDAALHTALVESGADVTLAPGAGYGEMTSHPQRAVAPREVFETVTRWLAEAPAGATRGPSATPVAELDALELDAGGVTVRESAMTVEHAGGRLVGILTEPPERSGDTALVLLNAGAMRRSGPNRMWTELAREWARRGVPVLRIDVEGLGDSDGDETPYADDGALYEDRLAGQLLAALDELERRGVATRFIAGGLCSGAYWAFHALRAGDPRLRSALIVNLFAFFWHTDLPAQARAPRASRLLSPAFWARALRGRLNRDRVRLFLRRVVRAPFERHSRRAARRTHGDLLETALMEFELRGQRAWLFLNRNEPLYERIERDGGMARLEAFPALETVITPGGDHTFRAVWMQQALRDALDGAIESELARIGTEGATGSLSGPGIAAHGRASA